MRTEAVSPGGESTARRFNWLHITLIVLLSIIVTAVATAWVVTVYLFPSEFQPVTLNQKEEQVLNQKLDRLDWIGAGGISAPKAASKDTSLEPEAYSEAGASREIFFTEKELNAMLAKNTDLARKLAVDLSDDLVSAKLLVPVDEDFPLLGGKTIKVRAGLELSYQNTKPIVVLKGISIMGVPLPNAWLGGIKNIDLVKEFGDEKGFWKAFADGVEHIQVKEGNLKIKLKE